MKPALPLLICATLALGGCARITGSSLNPLNWFGSSTSGAVALPRTELPALVTGGTQVIESRALVSTVTALRVDRTPSGAIVTAQGEVPTQGYFNAELVRIGLTGSVLTFAFRAEAPSGFEATGAPRTRSITAAIDLDAADLAGVSTIRVEGQGNARTAAR